MAPKRIQVFDEQAIAKMGMGAVHGTPEDPADPTGVTVASEYGARQR